MLNFLVDHWGSLAIGAVLAGIVVLIAIKLYKDRKKGKHTCGCGCSNCPSAGICHKKMISRGHSLSLLNRFHFK